MAEEQQLAEKAEDEKSSKFFLVFPLLNTIAILVALGFLTYSKLYFRRRAITDEGERERLASFFEKQSEVSSPTFLKLEPLTVNIRSAPWKPKPADGTSAQIEGKLHYVTVAISMELRDPDRKELVNSLKPYILDQLILLLGKKQFHELITVQGRYVLSSQILEMVNQTLFSRASFPSKEDLVTHIYFTQFIVQ